MLQEHHKRTVPTAARITGWLACAPLVLFAILIWSAGAMQDEARFVELMLAYGALLLSFMGGVRWGYALKAMEGKSSYVELGAALLPGLAGWMAFLASPLYGAVIQIAAFLFQALWDLLSGQTGRLPDWAVKLRVEMACIAIVALLALTAALIWR